jgi:hypothetical protein
LFLLIRKGEFTHEQYQINQVFLIDLYNLQLLEQHIDQADSGVFYFQSVPQINSVTKAEFIDKNITMHFLLAGMIENSSFIAK